jgi:hypothetical protein
MPMIGNRNPPGWGTQINRLIVHSNDQAEAGVRTCRNKLVSGEVIQMPAMINTHRKTYKQVIEEKPDETATARSDTDRSLDRRGQLRPCLATQEAVRERCR